MKTLKLIIASLMLSGSLSAQASTLLLEKIVSSGYVPQEYQNDTNCKVYDDKVRIARTVGFLNWTEEKVMPAQDLERLNTMIRAAAVAKVETKPMPTDIPVKAYYAHLSGSETPVTLLVETHDGYEFERNAAHEAVGLINLLDALCD